MRQVVWIAVVSSLGLLPGMCLAAEVPATVPTELPAARQADRLVQQWLDTERQASALESDWVTQKPLLLQRIALLRARREQLGNVLADSRASRSEVETQRTSLLAEQESMESQQAKLQRELKRLQRRLQGISAMLPPPLQTAWRDEAAGLGDAPDTSVQLQVALAQLDKLLEFNQRITVSEAPLATEDGREVVVQQLYLGAGSAWFSSADGSVAGSGRASAGGWRWQFDNGVKGASVLDAVAMFRHQREAALVQLPLQIGGGAQ